jgi:PKD domain-containing protein
MWLNHSASTTVTVTNVAPSVTAPASATIYSGDTLYFRASFSDPGTLDAPWSISIDWGDGPPTTGSTADQSKLIAGAHQHFRTGSYGVRVAVTDKDGGVGADTVALVVARFPTLIDVAPKDPANIISIKSGGQTLTVALLSTSTYDARVADPASALITNGSGSGTRLRGTRVGRDYDRTDVNRDGRIDLVLYFYKKERHGRERRSHHGDDEAHPAGRRLGRAADARRGRGQREAVADSVRAGRTSETPQPRTEAFFVFRCAKGQPCRRRHLALEKSKRPCDQRLIAGRRWLTRCRAADRRTADGACRDRVPGRGGAARLTAEDRPAPRPGSPPRPWASPGGRCLARRR